MVIADISPLNYLILIGADDVLRQLYGEIAVPVAVLAELKHAETPVDVFEWISKPRDWIRDCQRSRDRRPSAE
jgi:predicted nucleic acid-binding protein